MCTRVISLTTVSKSIAYNYAGKRSDDGMRNKESRGRGCVRNNPNTRDTIKGRALSFLLLSFVPNVLHASPTPFAIRGHVKPHVHNNEPPDNCKDDNGSSPASAYFSCHHRFFCLHNYAMLFGTVTPTSFKLFLNYILFH